VKAGGKLRYVPQKRRFAFNGLHGVISKKIVRFTIEIYATFIPIVHEDISLFA
jgi:hypothetical protein